MVKYSFIVPVYNTEKYLDKCLNSLVSQTFSDFEIVIVNDGSTDGGGKIISKYAKVNDNIKVIEQENEGLSTARNNGVKKATGKYLIFIDSDDYVEKDLLKVIDENIFDNDVLRFQIITEDEEGNNVKFINEKPFSNLSGPLATSKIIKYKYVELACCYVFKHSFWTEHNFAFEKNRYHEDFGLIPFVIFSASVVSAADYPGYHYVQRNGSIMSNKDYEKNVKKANDILWQYFSLKKKISDDKFNDVDKTDILSFLANSVILKASFLKANDFKNYVKKLKDNKVFDDVKTNGFKRKVKKFLMMVDIKTYLKVIK